LPICNVVVGRSEWPTVPHPVKPNFKDETTRAEIEFRSPHACSPVDRRLTPLPRLIPVKGFEVQGRIQG